MSLRFTGMFTIWLKLMFQKFGGLGFLKGTILLRNHCLWLLANVVWFLQQMIIDMMPSFISSQHYQRKLDLLVLKIHYWIFLVEYLETLWLGSLLQELLTCAMIHAFVFLTLCSNPFDFWRVSGKKDIKIHQWQKHNQLKFSVGFQIGKLLKFFKSV